MISGSLIHWNGQPSAELPGLEDRIYRDENILRNILDGIPLAFLRYKRLRPLRANLGYVSIFKDQKFKIDDHATIGQHINLGPAVNFGQRWAQCNDSDQRRQLIIHAVNHIPQHENVLKDFFQRLFRGGIILQPPLCAGCLGPITTPPGTVTYTEGSLIFCATCYQTYCDKVKKTMEDLDEVWMGVVLEWEETARSLAQRSPSGRIYFDMSAVDSLSREIHWRTFEQLELAIKCGERHVPTSYFCDHLLSRLNVQIKQVWPKTYDSLLSLDGHENYHFAQLNLSSLERGSWKEEAEFFDKLANSEQGVMLLKYAAHTNPSYGSDAEDPVFKLITSSDVARQQVESISWFWSPLERFIRLSLNERGNRLSTATAGQDQYATQLIADQSAMLDRLADEAKDLIQLPSDRTQFRPIYQDLMARDRPTTRSELQDRPLREALRQEVSLLYQTSTGQPWREYVDLVCRATGGGASMHDRITTFIAGLESEGVEEYYHAEDWQFPDRGSWAQHLFWDLGTNYYSEDPGMLLQAWLMLVAEDFLYGFTAHQDDFVECQHNLAQHHTLAFRLVDDEVPRPTVPLWIKAVQKTFHWAGFGSRIRIEQGDLRALGPDWRVVEGGEMAWKCHGTDREGRELDCTCGASLDMRGKP